MIEVVGTIELGGTKIVCGLVAIGQLDKIGGNANNSEYFTAMSGHKDVEIYSNEQKRYYVLDRKSISTQTPDKSLPKVVQYFSDIVSGKNAFATTSKIDLQKIGIGSFGPIIVDKNSSEYGFIAATPKAGWANFDLLGSLKQSLPFVKDFAWTTDVNAPALSELKIGAGYRLDGKNNAVSNLVYYTVGTGIGGGTVYEGAIFGQMNHQEMGHVLVKRHPNDNYIGSCPYHKDCLEGLAAGPSLEARSGIRGEDLPPNHELWDIIAYYLAQACMQSTLLLMPQRIVFGGGLAHQTQLFPKIRQSFAAQMADYVTYPDLDSYIVPCGLGDNAGILGCAVICE